jgi:hypothetical protein
MPSAAAIALRAAIRPIQVRADSVAVLELRVAGLELGKLAAELVALQRRDRHQRLVGGFVGTQDAKPGEAVAVVDDGIDLRVLGKQAGQRLLQQARIPVGDGQSS